MRLLLGVTTWYLYDDLDTTFHKGSFMASAREFYQHALISAKRMKAKEIKGKIGKVYPETIKDTKGNESTKLVVELQDEVTRIALNKTNANVLIAAYGDDTDRWEGKPIVIYKDRTSFGGESCDGLRVRAAAK